MPLVASASRREGSRRESCSNGASWSRGTGRNFGGPSAAATTAGCISPSALASLTPAATHHSSHLSERFCECSRRVRPCSVWASSASILVRHASLCWLLTLSFILACAGTLRAMLGPSVPPHSRVKVPLAKLETSSGTSVPLLISLGCFKFNERYCSGAPFQVMILYRELDVLQLIHAPSL